jgi:hypothetical protein
MKFLVEWVIAEQLIVTENMPYNMAQICFWEVFWQMDSVHS